MALHFILEEAGFIWIAALRAVILAKLDTGEARRKINLVNNFLRSYYRIPPAA